MTDISDMTNEQLNERLAVDVMEFCFWDGVYYDEHGREIGLGDWQPTTDTNQAVECAERLDGMTKYHLSYYPDSPQSKRCIAVIWTDEMFRAVADNHARALSEAVLMAVRGGVD